MNAPVFIVGNSRSGTTLVARILNGHPAVHILNETHFMGEFAKERERFHSLSASQLFVLVNKMLTIQRKGYYRKHEYQNYPQDTAQIVSDFEKQPKKDFASLNRVFFEFEARLHGKTIAGDQTPRHVFYINELIEMYPGAKFIHMVRDPRAILLSQKRKWKAGRRRSQPRFEVLRTFVNYHPITTTLIWRKTIEAGLRAQQTIANNLMKTIFFEELVENPQKNIEDLCEFLNIEFFPGMMDVTVELSANKNDEGKRGIRKSVAEHWVNELSRTEIYLAERFAGSQMQRMGYTCARPEPNLSRLIYYILIWPFQLSIAFALNLGRMGNPFTYVAKRLFHKQASQFARSQST